MEASSLKSLQLLRVFIAECGFVNDASEFEAIGTDGLISCVAFSGYNYKFGSGFIAHFSTPDQVTDFFSRGVELIQSKGYETEDEFHCKIVGGFRRAKYSKEIVDTIKVYARLTKSLTFIIDEEDSLAETPFERSLLLNLRSGEWNRYSPTLKDRVLLPSEEDRYKKLESLERLYFVGSVL
jgi:hypothetical protein